MSEVPPLLCGTNTHSPGHRTRHHPVRFRENIGQNFSRNVGTLNPSGVPRSKETTPPYQPAVGLSLGLDVQVGGQTLRDYCDGSKMDDGAGAGVKP